MDAVFQSLVGQQVFLEVFTVLLAAPNFRDAMMAIGSLGAMLLVFGTVVVWALRRSMAYTRAQKDASDQTISLYRDAIALQNEGIRLVQEQMKIQAEGNRLISDLIEALRQFKHQIGENREIP